MKPLRIALTKGRLEQKTIELFESKNIECASLHDKGRKLIFSIDNGAAEGDRVGRGAAQRKIPAQALPFHARHPKIRQ